MAAPNVFDRQIRLAALSASGQDRPFWPGVGRLLPTPGKTRARLALDLKL
jgi:hypothetical protein